MFLYLFTVFFKARVHVCACVHACVCMSLVRSSSYNLGAVKTGLITPAEDIICCIIIYKTLVV